MERFIVYRIKTFFIALIMITILLFCGSQAQAAQEGDYNYTVTDGKAQITEYTGAGGAVTVPATLGGIKVTSIGDNAFNYTEITSITIPEGVASIGRRAFMDCTLLTSMVLPESLTSIGKEAFYGCTGLTDVTLPQGLTSIGEYAFSMCTGLTEISIPRGTTSIAGNAFFRCSSLTAISAADDNSAYISKEGMLFDKAGTVLVICPAGLASISIPQGVTSIGEYAFAGCKGLNSLKIPEGVSAIGDWAFALCSNLIDISISSGVTSIGSHAFNNCTGLTSITIPEGVSSIGLGAFAYCKNLTAITVADDNTAYMSKKGVLYNKTGTVLVTCPAGSASITIPQEVTGIGEYAFYGCEGLTSITLPEGLKSIGSNAFAVCTGLTSVSIPPGVTAIGNNVFSECLGLTSITLPPGITSIGNYAFNGCSKLTAVTIPEEVTAIGDFAFHRCSGLTSVTIPQKVTAIGNKAFRDCSGLTSITFKSAATTIGDNEYTIPAAATIIGPDPSTAKDYAAKYNRKFETLVNKEGDYTYTVTNGQAQITKYNGAGGVVTIPAVLGGVKVTSIGNRAFANAPLTSVTVPEGVTSIGSNAFYWCQSLTNITIAQSVTSIGVSAFYGCTKLTGITIPEGVTNIGGWAFYGCISLTGITIPAAVTDIGDNAFGNCTSLTNISVADKNSKYASKNGLLLNKEGTVLLVCPGGLTNMVIPQEVTAIGNFAFCGCKGLTSITIPEGITSIGASAFFLCAGLESITVPQGVTSIGDGAFLACTGLTAIEVDDDNAAYASKNGMLFNKAGTALLVCPGGMENVVIPQGVNAIGDGAFTWCGKIASLEIPQGITSIGEAAFSLCTGLTNIIMPDGITSIKESTFAGCTNLTDIIIPEGVTSIGDSAFNSCRKLTSITVPQSVNSMGENAFYGCTSLAAIKFNSDKTEIFDNENTIPADTLIIGPNPSTAKDYAAKYDRRFDNLLIQEGDYTYTVTNGQAQITGYHGAGGAVTIPAVLGGVKVTSIGNAAFENSPITSITFPQGITSIGEFAFSGCTDLTSIVFPQGLTSISDFAFSKCEGLTSITIPRTVTSIAGNAFVRCTGLTAFTVDENNPVFAGKNGLLVNKAGTTLIACPGGLTDPVIPPEIERIGNAAFAFCIKISGLTIPQGVTSIDDRAFFGCKNLTSVDLPEGVTSIGQWAFSWCTGLTEITIPEKVIGIGTAAFYGSSNLTSIRFNSPTTMIDDNEASIPVATKIIGYDPSVAKHYAIKHNRTFEVLWRDWPVTLQKGSQDFLTVTFSKEVAMDSVSEENIYVAADEAGVSRVSGIKAEPVTDSAGQIKITPPDGGWPAGINYLFVSGHVKSASGKLLTRGIRMKFNVTM